MTGSRSVMIIVLLTYTIYRHDLNFLTPTQTAGFSCIIMFLNYHYIGGIMLCKMTISFFYILIVSGTTNVVTVTGRTGCATMFSVREVDIYCCEDEYTSTI